MQDRENRFVSKEELNPRLKNLEDKIDQLRATGDATEGWGRGVSAGWAVLIAVVIVLVSIAGVVVAFMALGHSKAG